MSLGASAALGANILYIVADTGGAGYERDLVIGDFLTGLGHEVIYYDDNESEADTEVAAADADLVYISESVSSGQIRTEITEIETPMIIAEAWAWDEMGLTHGGGGGGDVDATDIEIVNAGHFLAAGLSGSVAVLTSTSGADGTARFGRGQAGNEATVIATASTGDVIYVYEKGAALPAAPADGSAQLAADMRICLGFDYRAQVLLNDNAYALIEAAVNYALGQVRPKGQAYGPQPTDGQTDVLRDVTLGWMPGQYVPAVGGHTVYLGEDFDDVNDGIGGIILDANALTPPDGLDFGQTYYWRVDEANGTTGADDIAGPVWRFTVETFANPVEGVTATASSSNDPELGPENTINGSGLDALDQHSTTATDMWLSAAGADHWIQYEFTQALKLHEMWVWNSNQMIESFLGLGAKDVTIETSLDGTTWTVLEAAPEFAQAPGKATYTANTVVGFGGAMAQFVRITVNTGWGMLPQYGLSEVRFFAIPVQAREPEPVDGVSTDSARVTLAWRAGREAASHEVSLGTDSTAMSVIGTTDETSLDAGALDYGTTYFWRVDEINEAETPARYAGNVWSFTTPGYGTVDDFDQYNDNCNRIFFAWADGLGHNGGTEIDGCDVPASNGNGGGSIVGNDQAPFAEQAIVTAGSSQSLPFNYDNAFGPSEARLSLPGQDWTASGVQTLALAFFGTAGNTGTLYVKINNSKVVYDLDPADIARSSWQAWNIDLTSVGGLQNVTSLTIGVDGTSAAGMLYIDDIRLHPQSGELITPAEPDDAGLLTYLSFDEGAGTIAGDASGNGHAGSLVGPPQWVAGKVGGALQFGNGSHVLDDDAEDYINGLSAITIAVWIKSGVVDTDSGFIIFEEPAGNDRRGIRYDADGGEGDVNLLKYGMEYTGGSEEDESPANLQTTDWQHVAVTSASGAGLSLYINGSLVIPEEDAGAATGVITGCTTLIVGKGGKDEVNSAGWDGLIDELRIYGRALSAAEVMGLAGRTQAAHKPL